MKKELIREKKKSLADRYPELAKEWHTELNGDLTPYDVTPHSQIKVWWKTEEGKEFQAVVRYRTTNYLRKDKNLIPEEISGKYRKIEEISAEEANKYREMMGLPKLDEEEIK
jgi:hypothetical protein